METINNIFALPQLREVLIYYVYDCAANIVIFAALAVPLFYLFWVIYTKKFQTHRIQTKRSRTSLAVRSEIRNSIMSLFIFSVVDALNYLAQLKGYTKIYTHVSDYGWWYLGFSAVVLIFLHDTIYYFMHRFMHHPKVYNLVHKVHHQSSDPSPFATFSFHPIEAVMEAGVYVIFAFLLPVHMIALWTWQLIQVTLNVVAHLGYEVYPKNLNKHWLLRFKAPCTHHNMHHAKFHGNYGLYFTWWDKIFGTEFKDYNETYDAIHERIDRAKFSKTA